MGGFAMPLSAYPSKIYDQLVDSKYRDGTTIGNLHMPIFHRIQILFLAGKLPPGTIMAPDGKLT